MQKFKILFIGGTWNETWNDPDEYPTGYTGLFNSKYDSPEKDIDLCKLNHTYGKASGLADKIIRAIKPYASVLSFANGGKYSDLEHHLKKTKNYDIVFWWANVDNKLPKIRDVKETAPHVMLITSKRNDNDKYTFQELNQRALASKSNLVFEFKKVNDKFKMMIFDPLGCSWYDGFDTDEAVEATMNRLSYLTSITRQKTTQISNDKGLILKWYFDQFAQDQIKSDKTIDTPCEQEFVDLVKEYAETFHLIMKPAANVKRFLGNCSMKPFPPQVGRCSKGMPSFRKDGYIFVSQRNVDKEFLTLENFVPTYLENNQVYYCGENKPSVDTPIQLRLYELLPNINYMIHAHVYIENAPYSTYPIPCGAIEEVDEIKKVIEKEFGTFDGEKYHINLLGHGSIIMGKTIDDLKNVRYYGRTLPEKFN